MVELAIFVWQLLEVSGRSLSPIVFFLFPFRP